MTKWLEKTEIKKEVKKEIEKERSKERDRERKKERERETRLKWNGNVSFFRTTILKRGREWNELICHCLEFVTPLLSLLSHSAEDTIRRTISDFKTVAQ